MATGERTWRGTPIVFAPFSQVFDRSCTFFGQKLRGSFRKGVGVPIGVPGRGVWGRVQVVDEGFFLMENDGKGEGGGEAGVGWGQAKEPASQCALLLSQQPLSKLPFSFSRFRIGFFSWHYLPAIYRLPSSFPWFLKLVMLPRRQKFIQYRTSAKPQRGLTKGAWVRLPLSTRGGKRRDLGESRLPRRNPPLDRVFASQEKHCQKPVSAKSRHIPPNPTIRIPDWIPSGVQFRKGRVPSNPVVCPLEGSVRLQGDP